MKAIIPVILAAILLFTLAACGNKEEMKDDVKEELTTIRDDVSDAVEEGKNDAEDMGDRLTENGNVTGNTTEGMLNEALTDLSEMLEGNKEDTTVVKETTEVVR